MEHSLNTGVQLSEEMHPDSRAFLLWVARVQSLMEQTKSFGCGVQQKEEFITTGAAVEQG